MNLLQIDTKLKAGNVTSGGSGIFDQKDLGMGNDLLHLGRNDPMGRVVGQDIGDQEKLSFGHGIR